MKLLRTLLLTMFTGSLSGIALSNGPEAGMMSLYPDQAVGRQTASGEIYDGRTLTGAHHSLPFGTMVRVANFSTGRMLDVRINDRKARDAKLLHLSHAAGQRLGIGSNQTVQGSMMVVGTAPAQQPAPAAPAAPSVPTVANVPIPGPEGQVAGKPFRPFSNMAQEAAIKKSVNNPNAVVDVPEPSYGQAPPTSREEKGGFFSGLFQKKNPPMPSTAPPAPNPNASGAVIPLSASTASAPVMAPPKAQQQVFARQDNNAPFRVQFGAYSKLKHARETSAVLNRSGVRTMVAPARGRPLHLVISENGFPSAEQAQGWINAETARRGWQARPVVIR